MLVQGGGGKPHPTLLAQAGFCKPLEERVQNSRASLLSLSSPRSTLLFPAGAGDSQPPWQYPSRFSLRQPSASDTTTPVLTCLLVGTGAGKARSVVDRKRLSAWYACVYLMILRSSDSRTFKGLWALHQPPLHLRHGSPLPCLKSWFSHRPGFTSRRMLSSGPMVSTKRATRLGRCFQKSFVVVCGWHQNRAQRLQSYDRVHANKGPRSRRNRVSVEP